MLGIPDPYTLAAKVVIGAVLILGAAATGAKLGYNYSEGQNARTEVLIEKAGDAAQLGAAAAIAKIQPKYVTIQQKTETITREVPVYRDCHNTPDELRLLNSALTNSDVAEPVDSGELPKPDAPK